MAAIGHGVPALATYRRPSHNFGLTFPPRTATPLAVGLLAGHWLVGEILCLLWTGDGAIVSCCVSRHWFGYGLRAFGCHFMCAGFALRQTGVTVPEGTLAGKLFDIVIDGRDAWAAEAPSDALIS